MRRIPTGRVATYGDVAAWAGSPRAARAVGSILRECRDTYTPCHRVVGAGGALGGFGGREYAKRERLAAEGVETSLTRVRHFADLHWQPSHARRATPRPGPPV